MKTKPKKLEMELDPELMAGQMVLAGFDGKTLPDRVGDALAKGRLSGVVLFERNIESPKQIRDLTDSIRAAAFMPPIIAIDQEGGRVSRLSAPFTKWPAMRNIGLNADARTARQVAGAVAAELMAVGINTDFAPVLDVDSNPDNPVIGDRSLGPDAQRVARLGAAMVEGFRAAGLISCAKHFPGHGDASVDSHKDLPEIEADVTTLDQRELTPFRESIRNRVPMVMTAHVKVRALDPYYPATISRKVVYDMLRSEMGFDGVIVTDDLEMGALSKYMPIEDAAFSALRAGVDMLMVCGGPDKAEEARQVIVESLKQGLHGMAEASFSIRRILGMKEDYLLGKLPPRDEISRTVGRSEHQALAKKLA